MTGSRTHLVIFALISAVVLLAGSDAVRAQRDERAKLLPSDGDTEDYFGRAAAIAGDTIVIGAHEDDDSGTGSGSAYVFRFDGADWVQADKLLADDGTTGDHFGGAVAISGDVMVIGAYGDDDKGSDSGSAYVFRFDGSSWNQEQKLLASDGAASDLFGYAVAVSGDVAVIGAYGDNDNGSDSGSAYVFRFDGSSWNQEQKLLASDGDVSDYFGRSVAVFGDVVLIGAYGDDDNGSGAGAAYVFRFDGSSWDEEDKLLATDGAEGERFGDSVAVSGDVAFIGARYDDDNGYRSGSTYVLRFDGDHWVELEKLLALDGAAEDYFGGSVAIAGGTAVIGAYGDDENGAESGSAYLFRFDGARWVEETKLLPSDGAVDDAFGFPVALSGDVAVIGARFNDDHGNDSGSAYVFDVEPLGGGLGGQVFDGRTGAALGDVLVSLGDANDTTNSNGQYEIAGPPAGLSMVAFEKAGFYPTQREVVIEAGSVHRLNVPLYSNPGGSDPVVVEVHSRYSGPDRRSYYLDGVSLSETFTATVEWNGHPPGVVQFITTNGVFDGTGDANTWSYPFDVGTAFGEGETLSVVAIADGGGPESEPYHVNMKVVPAPPGLTPPDLAPDLTGSTLKYMVEGGRLNLELGEGVPGGEIPEDVPLFGSRPFTFGVSLTADGDIAGDGSGALRILEVEDAASNSIQLAGFEFIPEASGRLGWRYDEASGAWISGGDLRIEAAAGAEVPPEPFHFSVGACPLCLPAYWRGPIDIITSNGLTVTDWSGPEEPTWNGTLNLDPFPTALAALGVGATDLASLQGTLGGGASMVLQYPQEDPLEALQVFLAGGAQLDIFTFQYDWPLLECTWDYASGLGGCDWDSGTLRGGSDGGPDVRVTPRGYLDRGDEYAIFVANNPVDDGFRNGTAEETPLQLNVFSQSTPDLVADGDDLVLAWVHDDPNRTPINRTQAVLSTYDSASETWSIPAAVADDGTADFHPQLALMPNGDRLLAWENVSDVLAEPANPDDPAQVEAKLEEMKSKTEIVVARYVDSNGWWQEPVPITSNGYLDRSPRLATATNGTAMLTWVGNTANDAIGSNGRPNDIHYATFSALDWSQDQKFLASDGATQDTFGWAVAVSGDTAVIGAYRDADTNAVSGSAYVFRFDGSNWVEQQKLVPADGADDDFFGYAVAASGDTAVIGAYGDDDHGSRSGSAYVFRFDGLSWVEEQKLSASDGAANDFFGVSVGVSGDTAVVGAYGDGDNGLLSGSAYVFVFDGANWVEAQKLLALDGADVDLFGYAVAIDAESIVIGAPFDDDNGPDSGSTYVFGLDGASWVQQEKLLAYDGAEYDFFGCSVAIDGDTILVGAYQDDDTGTGVGSGSAYPFRFDGLDWGAEPKLVPSDGEASDYFGFAVAIAGERAVIGAPYDDDLGDKSGSAYAYRYDGGNWVQDVKLVPADGAALDAFGTSVAVVGDTALIGSPLDGDQGDESGSAYVFHPRGVGWSGPGTIAAGVTSIVKTALAYDGTNAILLFTGDTDGNNDTPDDRELFAAAYDGAWGAVMQLTDDTGQPVPDANPQVAYDANGDPVIAWYRGGDIYLATDLALSDQHVVVDLPGASSGAADFRLATGANGQIAFIWQNASEDLVDLWYATYDCSLAVWSKPQRLTADDSLEHSTAPVYDASGDLVAAYDKVQTIYEARTVTVGGQDIEIDNVPIPHQTDLYVLRHERRGDLAINSNGVSVSPANPVTGQTATLTAIVRNLGDVPAADLEVAFYEGDPDGAGTLIDVATHGGPLVGGDDVAVGVQWSAPASTNSLDLYVVVDPDLHQEDYDRANNTAMLGGVRKPDLTVTEIGAQTIGPHGIVTVRLANDGALPAAAVEIALRRDAVDGELLATLAITEPIVPGTYHDVSWLWPDIGPLPAGWVEIFAVADEANTIDEFDEDNNVRSAILARGPTIPGDWDGDGDVDMQDYAHFPECLSGPRQGPEFIVPSQECLTVFDFDSDTDVDLRDAAEFTLAFTD